VNPERGEPRDRSTGDPALQREPVAEREGSFPSRCDCKSERCLGIRVGNASRPALDELRRAVKRGEVTEVMSAALDRLGRSLRDLILLLDEFAAAGCAVITLREGIDLSTPSGRLTMHLLAAIGEFERSLIRQRIQSGIAKVKETGRSRTGRPLGRPRRDVDLERVAALRAKELSWRAIAVSMKTPRRTLERAFEAVAQNPLPKSRPHRPRRKPH